MKKKLLFILSLLPAFQSTHAFFESYDSFSVSADNLISTASGFFKPLKKRVSGFSLKSFKKKIKKRVKNIYARYKEKNIKKQLRKLSSKKLVMLGSLSQKYYGYFNTPLDKQGNNSIMIAAENGNSVFLESVLTYSGIKLNLENENGWSAYDLTIKYGYSMCLKLLLDYAPAYVDLKDEKGRNLIVKAAEFKRTGCLSVLRDHARITKEMKKYAFIYLTEKEDEKALKALVHSELISQEWYDNRAAFVAVENNNKQKLEVILKKLKNNTYKDLNINDPESIVNVLLKTIKQEDTLSANVLATYMKIKYPEWHKIVVNRGNTRVMEAAIRGDLPRLKLFIDHLGADPNVANMNRSALMKTALFKKIVCLNYLLNHPNTSEETKQEAYKFACSKLKSGNKGIKTLYKALQPKFGKNDVVV